MIWTTAELAKEAGVTPDFVTQEIRRGRLKAEKRGIWLIADADAQEWLSNPRRGSMSEIRRKGGDAGGKKHT